MQFEGKYGIVKSMLMRKNYGLEDDEWVRSNFNDINNHQPFCPFNLSTNLLMCSFHRIQPFHGFRILISQLIYIATAGTNILCITDVSALWWIGSRLAGFLCLL